MEMNVQQSSLYMQMCFFFFFFPPPRQSQVSPRLHPEGHLGDAPSSERGDAGDVLREVHAPSS